MMKPGLYVMAQFTSVMHAPESFRQIITIGNFSLSCSGLQIHCQPHAGSTYRTCGRPRLRFHDSAPHPAPGLKRRSAWHALVTTGDCERMVRAASLGHYFNRAPDLIADNPWMLPIETLVLNDDWRTQEPFLRAMWMLRAVAFRSRSA